MKVLQLIVVCVVYIVVVVHGARWTNAPLWLVSIVIIGPFVWWLYAPMFRRRPSDLREDDRGVAPSLLDLLLEQPPRSAVRARVRARIEAIEGTAERSSTVPSVPRKRDETPSGDAGR